MSNGRVLPTSKRLKLRVISVLLTGALCLHEGAQGALAQNPSFEAPFSVILKEVSKFETPADFAVLKETYQGSSGRLIIHIQDPHSNLSGQENLAKALDQIMARYGVYEVLVEGGQGDGTLSAIREAIPKEMLGRNAKSLLVRGEISGEEYLNLTSKHPMTITGIEDLDLYAESLWVYRDLAAQRQEATAFLSRLRQALEKIKNKRYPRSLLDYEKVSGRRLGSEENLEQRVTMLAALAGPDLTGKFQNFQKFMAILDSPSQAQSGFQGLEIARVLEELQTLELQVYRRLVESRSARLAASIDRYLDLLEAAFKLELSSTQFRMLWVNEPDFSMTSVLDFVRKELSALGYEEPDLPLWGSLESAKKNLWKFYDLVNRRDEAFLQNTQKMKGPVSVLIAGGYHTEHLTERLKQAGYSYLVLAPRVTSETIQKKYERVLFEPLKGFESDSLGQARPSHGDTIRDAMAASRLPVIETLLDGRPSSGARLAIDRARESSARLDSAIQKALGGNLKYLGSRLAKGDLTDKQREKLEASLKSLRGQTKSVLKMMKGRAKGEPGRVHFKNSSKAMTRALRVLEKNRNVEKTFENLMAVRSSLFLATAHEETRQGSGLQEFSKNMNILLIELDSKILERAPFKKFSHNFYPDFATRSGSRLSEDSLLPSASSGALAEARKMLEISRALTQAFNPPGTLSAIDFSPEDINSLWPLFKIKSETFKKTYLHIAEEMKRSFTAFLEERRKGGLNDFGLEDESSWRDKAFTEWLQAEVPYHVLRTDSAQWVSTIFEKLSLSLDPYLTSSDIFHLKKALGHLLANHFDAILIRGYRQSDDGVPTSLSMSIGALYDPGNHMLKVVTADTGNGMTKVQLDSLFERQKTSKRFSLRDNRKLHPGLMGGVGRGAINAANHLNEIEATMVISTHNGQASHRKVYKLGESRSEALANPFPQGTTIEITIPVRKPVNQLDRHQTNYLMEHQWELPESSFWNSRRSGSRLAFRDDGGAGGAEPQSLQTRSETYEEWANNIPGALYQFLEGRDDVRAIVPEKSVRNFFGFLEERILNKSSPTGASFTVINSGKDLTLTAEFLGISLKQDQLESLFERVSKGLHIKRVSPLWGAFRHTSPEDGLTLESKSGPESDSQLKVVMTSQRNIFFNKGNYQPSLPSTSGIRVTMTLHDLPVQASGIQETFLRRWGVLQAGARLAEDGGEDELTLPQVSEAAGQPPASSPPILAKRDGILRDSEAGEWNHTWPWYSSLSEEAKDSLRRRMYRHYYEARVKTHILASDANMGLLVEIAKQLIQTYPHEKIVALGRSALWPLETARLLDDDPDRFSRTAFSGRWYYPVVESQVEDLAPDPHKAPTKEAIDHYRAYLLKIKMDPESLINSWEEKNQRTVILDYGRTGESMTSFLSLLRDWAAELGLTEELTKAVRIHFLRDEKLTKKADILGFQAEYQEANQVLIFNLSNTGDEFFDSPGIKYPHDQWSQDGYLTAKPGPNAYLTWFRIMDFLVTHGRDDLNEMFSSSIGARLSALQPSASYPQSNKVTRLTEFFGARLAGSDEAVEGLDPLAAIRHSLAVIYVDREESQRVQLNNKQAGAGRSNKRGMYRFKPVDGKIYAVLGTLRGVGVQAPLLDITEEVGRIRLSIADKSGKTIREEIEQARAAMYKTLSTTPLLWWHNDYNLNLAGAQKVDGNTESIEPIDLRGSIALIKIFSETEYNKMPELAKEVIRRQAEKVQARFRPGQVLHRFRVVDSSGQPVGADETIGEDNGATRKEVFIGPLSWEMLQRLSAQNASRGLYGPKVGALRTAPRVEGEKYALIPDVIADQTAIMASFPDVFDHDLVLNYLTTHIDTSSRELARQQLGWIATVPDFLEAGDDYSEDSLIIKPILLYEISDFIWMTALYQLATNSSA